MKRVAVIALLTLVSALGAAEDRVLKKSVLVHAPASEVWKAWSTAEGLKSWLAEGAKVELRHGGPFEIYFSTQAPEGQRGSEGCQVLSYLPERMLSFSWNAPPQFAEVRKQRSFVVVELEPKGPATTEVHLTHAGFGTGEEWGKVYAYFDKAWDFVTKALGDHFAKAGQPAGSANLDPVLQKLSNLIGGTWRVTLSPDKNPTDIEFRYGWTLDRKGIQGGGYIGKNFANPVELVVAFGIDPLTKKVYYLDRHNSDTVYFGHVRLEGEDLVYEFGPAGGDMKKFRSRARFLDKDTYETRILSVGPDGKETVLVSFKMKRS